MTAFPAIHSQTASKLFPEQSDGLRLAVVLGTILVVIRHSFNLEAYYEAGSLWGPAHDLNCLLQRTINEFTAIAVPAFFLMSGFWFFQEMRGYREIPGRLRKRARSLLLPLLLWNGITILLHIALARLPGWHDQALQRIHFQQGFSLPWLLDALTLHPALGVFWYIRTLILLCLLSPLVLFSYGNLFRTMLVLVAAIRLWHAIDLRLLSTEGFLFFYAGGLMAYHRLYDWSSFLRQPTWRIALCWCGILAFLMGKVLRPTFLILWYLYIVFAVGLFLVTCVKLTPCERLKNLFLRLAPHALFIYALHGLIIFLLQKTMVEKLPLTPAFSLLTFVMRCLVGCFVPLAASVLLRHTLPRIHAILIGGRFLGTKRYPQSRNLR